MAVFTQSLWQVSSDLGMNESYKPYNNHRITSSFSAADVGEDMNQNANSGGLPILDENVLLDLLASSSSRRQALQYIDQNLNENQNLLSLLDKHALFDEFHNVLSERNTALQIQCTKLIAKIVPHLKKNELDTYMQKVLPIIVSNVGNQAVILQKESIQIIHIYMKQSADVYKVLYSLAYDGIRNKDARTRQHVVVSFPTLLFPEFKSEDFFDIVHTLVLNFTENVVNHEILKKTLHKVKDFIGISSFVSCIDRLPVPLKLLLKKLDLLSAGSLENGENASEKSKSTVLEGKENKKLLAMFTPSISTNPSQYTNWKSGSGVLQNVAWHPDQETPTTSGKFYDKDTASSQFGISFISKELLESLTSSKTATRLQAVKDLKLIVEDLPDSTQLKENISPLISLLQPIISDKNIRVACAALQTMQVVLKELGGSMANFLSMFISSVFAQIGSSNDKVKSECMKVCFLMIDAVGPQKVLDHMWLKFQPARSQTREGIVNLVTAALLRISMKNAGRNPGLNIEKLCSRLAKLLLDRNPNVRKATLECFAVIGHFLGSDPMSLNVISNAINQVELQHENATGVMSAVNARLVRKQLPRLNELMLVEHAVLPAASSLASQSADMQWIAAAAASFKQRTDSKRSGGSVSASLPYDHSHQNLEKIPNPGRSSAEPPKKHASLGKQSMFPWTTEEAARHSNSAPVKTVRSTHAKDLPPAYPYSTWESESDASSTKVLRKKSEDFGSHGRSAASHDTATTYSELYLRKANALKSQSEAQNVQAMASASKSSYKPSFAPSSSHPDASGNEQGRSIFSSSCPSTFFEKNSALLYHGKNFSPSPSPTKSGNVSVTEESADRNTPILMKPALARSASKNRGRGSVDNSPARARQKSKSIDLMSVNLQDVGDFSPKAEKALFSPKEHGEGGRGGGGHHHLFMDGDEKEPKSSRGGGGGPGAASPPSYLPSTMQQHKPDKYHHAAASGKPPAASNPRASKSSAKPPAYEHADHARDKTMAHAAREVAGSPALAHYNPAIESKLLPSHHKQQKTVTKAFSSGDREREVMPDTSQMAAIRRSAQDKRQRMRSQPTSDDVMQWGTTGGGRNSSEQRVSSAHSPRSSVTTMASDKPTNLPDSIEDIASIAESVGKLSLVSKDRLQQHRNNSGGDEPSATTPPTIGNDVAVVGRRMDYVSHASNAATSVDNKTRNASVSSADKLSSKSSPENKFASLTSTSSLESTKNDTMNIQGKGVFFSPQKKHHRSDSNVSSNTSKEDLYTTWSPTSEDFGPKPARKSDSQTSSATSYSVKSSQRSYDSSSGYQSLPKHGVSDSRSYGTPASAASLETSKSSNIDHAAVNLMEPLEFPERAMMQAIQATETADPEQWEMIATAMFTIQRLSNFHPNVLATRFPQIVRALSKHVQNLRSQVSRNSVVTITSVYTNLKKPVTDTDLEVCVGSLLNEFGKSNVFMREEISKALNSIIFSTTPAKFLSNLLNSGLRHKNKDIRNVTSCFCSKLVTKVGADRALSGARDFTDRILDATSSFIGDSSPDVRYYGRCIVNDLMSNPQFEQQLDAYLSSVQVAEMKKCVASIKQRGLRSSQVGSGISRNRTSALRHQAPSQASGHSVVSSSATISSHEPEELKEICEKIGNGNLQAKREALDELFHRVVRRHTLSEDSIKKVMDVYTSLLTTANPKINYFGLQSLFRLLQEFGEGLKESLPLLVPAVLKLTLSKQHGELAKEAVNALLTHIDHHLLVQPFATIAHYGSGKSKQCALEKLEELVRSVGGGKRTQVVERHVLPVLWSIVNTPQAVHLRKELTQLTLALHELLGQRLLDVAEQKNLLKLTRDMIDKGSAAS